MVRSERLIQKLKEFFAGATDLPALRRDMRAGRPIGKRLRRALESRCTFEDERTLRLGPADQFFDELIGLHDKPAVPTQFSEDAIGYVEASVEAVLRMLDAIELEEHDLFCDVGSGLGRIPILVHLLTGLPTLGVEIDRELCAKGQALLSSNEIAKVDLRAASALDADLSEVTVFSFNLPFDDATLATFLNRIRPHPGAGAIRIYPYAWHLAFWDVPWLRPVRISGTDAYYFMSRD